MILDDKICRLADLYGIELHATIENKVYLLQAMGVLPKEFDVNDKDNVFNNAKTLDNIITQRIDAEYVDIVHQVSILRKNKVKELTISIPDGVDEIKWNLKNVIVVEVFLFQMEIYVQNVVLKMNKK